MVRRTQGRPAVQANPGLGDAIPLGLGACGETRAGRGQAGRNLVMRGLRFWTVSAGQRFCGVMMAWSREWCSGHDGSRGMRGMAAAMISRAAAALAERWPMTVWALTGSSSCFQQS